MPSPQLPPSLRGRTARCVCAAVLTTSLIGVDVASARVDRTSASLGRRECTPPKYPGKTGRSLDLVTFHLSCAMGRKISLAHYRARIKHGGSDGALKQNTKILGYKCFEQRLSNKGYYDGKVECTRGRKVSAYIYRQKR